MTPESLTCLNDGGSSQGRDSRARPLSTPGFPDLVHHCRWSGRVPSVPEGPKGPEETHSPPPARREPRPPPLCGRNPGPTGTVHWQTDGCVALYSTRLRRRVRPVPETTRGGLDHPYHPRHRRRPDVRCRMTTVGTLGLRSLVHRRETVRVFVSHNLHLGGWGRSGKRTGSFSGPLSRSRVEAGGGTRGGWRDTGRTRKLEVCSLVTGKEERRVGTNGSLLLWLSLVVRSTTVPSTSDTRSLSVSMCLSPSVSLSVSLCVSLHLSAPPLPPPTDGVGKSSRSRSCGRSGTGPGKP